MNKAIMLTALFLTVFTCEAFAQATSVQSNQLNVYSNKLIRTTDINTLISKATALSTDISTTQSSLTTLISNLTAKVNALTPVSCDASAGEKPEWNGTRWACSNDYVGTFRAFTASWTVGSWSACSASCGGGTQTRSVTCRSGYDCSGSPKPASSQTCNTSACGLPAGSWTTGSWSTCSGSCGGGSGTQTRSVTCPSGYDCSGAPTPASSQSCTNSTACAPVFWSGTGCSSCPWGTMYIDIYDGDRVTFCKFPVGSGKYGTSNGSISGTRTHNGRYKAFGGWRSFHYMNESSSYSLAYSTGAACRSNYEGNLPWEIKKL